jgi:AcrR family transcriptional regulator
MIIEMEKRKYTLRKRAEQQEDTRQRIVDAAIALHEELGPAETTVSAIAERAGVQRLTVYRYFPDDAALFGACTSGWAERHPQPPLPAAPLAPRAVAPALQALYAYYATTGRMLEMADRDGDRVPALETVRRAQAEYLDAYAGALASAWPERADTAPLAAAARLAVQFASWRTLADAGLDAPAMAATVTRMLAAAGR